MSFTTGATPTGAGEVLWVQLGANNTINTGSSGYDNVRLYALPTPATEPSNAAHGEEPQAVNPESEDRTPKHNDEEAHLNLSDETTLR